MANITKGNIGNALTSVASDHVVAVTEDLYDEALEKYQSEINEEFQGVFSVISNEEYLYAIVDTDNTILFGIKTDGDFYLAKKELYSVASSEEYLAAWTDKDGALLFGVKTDGTFYAAKSAFASTSDLDALSQQVTASIDDLKTQYDGMGAYFTFLLQQMEAEVNEVKEQVQAVADTFSIVSNDEYLHAVVDADGTLLFGITTEGKVYMPKQETYNVVSDNEWLAAWTDKDGALLFGVKTDGTFYAAKSDFDYDDTWIRDYFTSIQEAVDGLQEKVDGIDTSVLGNFSTMEDDEGRLEMTLDDDQTLLSYRDKAGVLHEPAGVETKELTAETLNLSDTGVEKMMKDLENAGFSVKQLMDWSDSSDIQIPEPRLAVINVSGISSMPTTKTTDAKAWLEFWDMQGNYFKKRVIVNAQGSSSMSFVKKNAAFDFCDDEWEGDDTPDIRFGDWVPQDSFHMKAYYTDFFRGVGVVSYKLWDEIMKTRGDMYDRPWKKSLVPLDKIKSTTQSLGNPLVDDYELQTDTGALCHPDGFPVAFYLNGDFYGIFSWQLKKHRDNYHEDKDTAEHVHLDGNISYDYILGGTIDWTRFEVRNPKNLYTMNGVEYDSDVAMEEIAGWNEVNAWIAAGELPDGTKVNDKRRTRLENTAKAKDYIVRLSSAITELLAARDVYLASSRTEEDLATLHEVFEKYFDPENVIDYVVFSDVVRNTDGVSKNTQWFTYDGQKWYLGVYDCDMTYGGYHQGTYITRPREAHVSTSQNYPFGYVTSYYKEELAARYKELADAGIIDKDHVVSLLKDWMMRIGTSFYKKEYEKWDASPCIADSTVREDYWELVYDENGDPKTAEDETFDAARAYSVDDKVSFGLSADACFFVFKCVAPTEALAENTAHTVSAYSPISKFSHSDNVYRFEKWVEEQIGYMDSLYSYERN